MSTEELATGPEEDAHAGSVALNNPHGNGRDETPGEETVGDNPALSMNTSGDYILDSGYCWITVGTLSVRVKKDDEGCVVDIYPLNDENSEPLASTYALFSEAESGEDAES